MDKEKNFLAFCNKRIYLKMIILVLLLSYIVIIVYGGIGIDDESMYHYLSGQLISQGRVGWNISNLFFEGYEYIPGWTILVGICLFLIGILLCIWIFDFYLNGFFSKKLLSFTIIELFCYPYIAKFAVFNGNMLMAGYVFCGVAIALYGAIGIFTKLNLKNVLFLNLGLCIIYLFEKTYVTFLAQFILAYLLIFQTVKTKIKFKQLIKYSITLLTSVIFAFLISSVIILIIQSATGNLANGYTSGYFRYDFSNINNFLQTLKSFIEVYLSRLFIGAKSDWAARIYLGSITILFILSVYNSLRKQNFLILISAIFAIVFSSIVPLVTGNGYLPYRTYCFNYVLLIVTTILYLGVSYSYNNLLRILFSIMAIILIANQIKEMENVYYNKYLTSDIDKRRAEDIISELEKVCGASSIYNKPIVFMGIPNDEICAYGEPEETSLFVWDRFTSTQLEEKSDRIVNFFHVLGYNINGNLKDIDFGIIRENIATMSAFPQKNSILETEDYIIVKLGDSLLEIVKDEPKWIYDRQFIGNIEAFSYANNVLNITGWLALNGESAYDSNISLIIKNDDFCYRLRSDEYTREDVTEYMSDGFNYDNSGIKININIPQEIEDGEYSLYFEIEKNGAYYLYNMDRSIII